MHRRPNSQERLEILRAVDNYRRWYSLDDKRICVVCERIISGRQIEIEGGPGYYTLHCPTTDCPSNFGHWLHYQPDRKAAATPPEGGVGVISFLSPSDR